MDLVVFSDDWGRRPSAPQHLFAVLARRHRILWVEPAGLRRPRPTRGDLARSAGKLRGVLRPSTPSAPWLPEPPSLTRLVPPVLPAYGIAAVRRANDAGMLRAVKAALARLRFVDPVLITTIPTMAGVVGTLGERCSIYWRVDDFSLWPGYDAPAIREREAVLLRRVDALAAAGENLLGPGPERQVLLRHGVDTGHFRRQPPPSGPPRALVAGRLDGRLDAGLIDQLARAMPELRIELLGEAVDVPSLLLARPNVSHHPFVPYAELPDRLDAHVLLLPYARSAWTDSLAPLKVREYLATGRPVVATPIPGLAQDPEVAPHLRFGEQSLVHAVRAALSEPPEAAERRRAACAAWSWERRAEDLEALISLLTSAAV